MHEKIRIKHFSVEMIPLKVFAKIYIKHFSNHLSGLKRFAKKKIKHAMSHSIVLEIEWLITCFIFLFAKRLRPLKWFEKCFILIFAKILRGIISIEKCFISIFSCILKSLRQAKVFYLLYPRVCFISIFYAYENFFHNKNFWSYMIPPSYVLNDVDSKSRTLGLFEIKVTVMIGNDLKLTFTWPWGVVVNFKDFILIINAF